MAQSVPITVAYGDGIGPEIMEAVLFILREAEAKLSIETIEVGEQVYKKGHSTGISPDSWESLRRTKVLLKAPITTPQGGGYKSLNVTIRKTLGLFANVRPNASYAPFVQTQHPKMDLVIVRENEEDLYAGIEYQHTPEVAQSIKVITREGSERIIRYAFEYALAHGRKKVTCMSKDNILKLADGMFHKLFDAIGQEYPEVEKDHYIIDIGAARIASRPEIFDVIVTQNLYGDIISDIAAEVSGSVGLAGSSNIGADFAMFEAIHGSAPDIAGQGIANPSGLLQGAVLMLLHLGQPEIASRVQNAWLKTIEDGIHTGDIFREGTSKEKVGTMAFAEAVVERLGSKPSHFAVADYRKPEKKTAKNPDPIRLPHLQGARELVGVDAFVFWDDRNLDRFGEKLAACGNELLPLSTLSARGLKIWPDVTTAPQSGDQLRARFRQPDHRPLAHAEVLALLSRLEGAGFEILKIEKLYTIGGAPSFTLGQGE